MWKKDRILADLQELAVRKDDALIVHASMRAIGPVEVGADAVVDALLDAVGPAGTILAPAFNMDNYAGAAWIEGLAGRADAAEESRDADGDGICVRQVGILPQRLSLRPEARRSIHPILSFVAVGRNSDFLTANAPFHYPLGTNSALAKLHQMDGAVLLLGVGHTVNSALHLAEIWADVPYARRSANIKTSESAWSTMQGSPECSAGFGKIEPVLRQARLLREGYVGNARTQYIRIRPLISMAVEILRGKEDFLLCDDPFCKWCPPARKLTAARR